MSMGQILAIAIIGTLLAIVVKSENNTIRLMVALATGLLIFSSICPPLQALIGILEDTATKAGVGEGYFTVVLKVIGIAYLAQFGTQVCIDAGESAIAGKVELAGKVLIMATSAPVLTGLLELVMSLV